MSLENGLEQGLITIQEKDELACEDEEKDADVFKIDRRKIQAVVHKPEELQSLDILVYDQDILEQAILDQVDEALEKQNRKNDSLEITIDLENQNENTSDDKSQNIECDINSYTGHYEQPQQPQASSSQSSQSVFGHGLLGAALCPKENQETEQERKVRLGEMTPFGSVLDVQSSPIQKNESLRIVNKYFLQQASLQIKHIKHKGNKKYNQERDRSKIHNPDSGVKTKFPLKKSILIPKKKKKKEILGTVISNNLRDLNTSPGKLLSEVTALYDSDEGVIHSGEDPNDSDYKPEEDDEEEVWTSFKAKATPRNKSQGKRQRKKNAQKEKGPPEDWGTDDSDWEYSDDEAIAQRRKSIKKEIDDGNLEDYHKRVHLWESTKSCDELEDNHKIDGGLILPKTLWTKLYKYQKVGVQWLWELHQQRCGGILGDEMGLGKTIQLIAFLAGLARSKLAGRHQRSRGLGPSLIVCPTTVMHQWVREFHIWWPPFRVAILHESGSFAGKKERLIDEIAVRGGILVTSFVGVMQNIEKLVARNWHYVILDEGHKIRNPDAQVTLAVKQFRTPHRLILSGSPMQNSLKELWSLFDFVFPGKLGTLPVFLAQFAVPITQGGYANASEVQVATAYRCATVLRDTIAPYLLRRMKSDVRSHVQLPEKSEQVLFCRLGEEQRQFYQAYLNSGEVQRILQGQTQIFLGLIALRKICNHPDLYSGGPKLFRGDSEDNLREEERYGYWRRSGKMIVVEALLKIWHKQGHKVLLFTQSRQMLCILEAFVQKQGYTYLKLDGGTSISARQPLINKFNQDPQYFVFLLTTRVGGLGVNLTGANRVVIYDPDWNPATDTQARERAWRIGQKREVTVYRLVTAGTIEEKVYHRQIFKQFLTNKVLSDPKQRRFFKSNDLFELFTLKESDREGSTETAAIFAGTGSEVRLHRNKKKEKKYRLQQALKTNSFRFSPSKVERMKLLAQKLSKVIGINAEKKVTPRELLVDDDIQNLVRDLVNQTVMSVEHLEQEKPLVSETLSVTPASPGGSQELTQTPDDSRVILPQAKRRKHRHKPIKKKIKCLFEGNEVPNLVSMEETRAGGSTDCTSEQPTQKEQDDYVLRKLFKKSGLQTVLKHDRIMQEGSPDYALVEGEAQRVAREAVRALKESRRECWSADSGVPSWTGVSGSLRRSKLSKKLERKSVNNSSGSTSTAVSGNGCDGEERSSILAGSALQKSSSGQPDKPMSASDLLNRMRSRNTLTGASQGEPEPELGSSVPVTRPVTGNVQLLTDIRNFVAFGASAPRRASTDELVAEFRERLPCSSTPLFKFLLQEVCEFTRLPSGQGVWRLRSEFLW